MENSVNKKPNSESDLIVLFLWQSVKHWPSGPVSVPPFPKNDWGSEGGGAKLGEWGGGGQKIALHPTVNKIKSNFVQ